VLVTSQKMRSSAILKPRSNES